MATEAKVAVKGVKVGANVAEAVAHRGTSAPGGLYRDLSQKLIDSWRKAGMKIGKDAQ